VCIISGGAGGKGTWGAIGEVLDEEDLKVKDHQDPNYESEDDEDVSLCSQICQ
jgi:hypothetical protein